MEFENGYIDVTAIEQKAHKLRAEAAREMAKASAKWVRSLFVSKRATKLA